VRFEDLSLSLNKTVSSVLQFYGMAFDDKIVDFLSKHSSGNAGDEFSTFRNSSAIPFMWTKKLTFDEVKEIQGNCSEAMELWGYRKAKSSEELEEDFYPILPFEDFDLRK
jgi:hypothetical protein